LQFSDKLTINIINYVPYVGQSYTNFRQNSDRQLQIDKRDPKLGGGLSATDFRLLFGRKFSGKKKTFRQFSNSP